MDSGGPHPGRDHPDEPDGQDDAPIRGWIPPDDRLWRHPSEVSSLAGASGPNSSRRERSTVLAAGAAGAAVVVVAMAAAFAMAGPGPAATSHPLAVTMTSLTTTSSNASASTLVGGTVPTPNISAMVAALRPSLVGVEPVDAASTSSSPPTLTGIVLPGGRLVVTAASAAVGMHVVDVVTADGKHHRGSLVGADGRSGVAVVTVSDVLPAATFADEATDAGSTVIAACLCIHSSPNDTDSPAPSVSTGLVETNGEPAELADGTDLVDTLQVSVPLSPGSWGTVLLDQGGRVIGILDAQQQSAGKTTGIFVPAPLALAVADALAGSRDMGRGWLGVVCTDPATSSASGPVVATVIAGGPAAGAGVEPGDVVTAVDGHRVATIAELQARLYALSPGAAVVLTLARAGGPASVTITLSAEPS